MTTLTRLDERRAIRDRIEAAEAQRREAHKHPDILAARQRIIEARKALDAAHEDFDGLRKLHITDDDDLVLDLRANHPDLLVVGASDYGDNGWVSCCELTGLPIFRDDMVLAIDDHDSDVPGLILAVAVSVATGLAGEAPSPQRACEVAGLEEDAEDEEELEDDDSADIADDLVARSESAAGGA